ncbi:MAG TPA: UPF0175 family protein [Thermomicrobiales bacterium]|nr:UPF0175 family protein [Thermomicrobiales bacterium]
MQRITITVELPDELFEMTGTSVDVAETARESLVLNLLGEARISQGQAARLLGITRWRLLKLIAQYEVTTGPASAKELHQDIEAGRRSLQTI